MDGDTPRLTPTGAPLTRAAWVPVTSARIEDTWSVVGLRATGSHDFIVDDVLVDKASTSSFAEPPFEPGQLYSPRLFFVTLWVIVAANALGIARGAIDAFIDLAGRSSTSSPVPLRDRAAVQARVAEAEAILECRPSLRARHGGSCLGWRGRRRSEPRHRTSQAGHHPRDA